MCCWLNRPLKRMTVGMVLAAIAFVCAALVQLEIDVSKKKSLTHYDSFQNWQLREMSSHVLCTSSQKTLPIFPSSSQSQLKILNMGDEPVTVTLPGFEPVVLPANQVCLHIVNTKYQRDLSLQVYNSKVWKEKKRSAMQSCLPCWHGIFLTG